LIYVEIEDAAEAQTAADTMNDSAKANAIRMHLSPGVKLLELDLTRYFLSGHPAIRLIEIRSYGRPGEPGASQGIEPHDAEMMMLFATSGGKGYSVGYLSVPERFNDYLQIEQEMINSFQIISKQ
jgi:hypothetical protein